MNDIIFKKLLRQIQVTHVTNHFKRFKVHTMLKVELNEQYIQLQVLHIFVNYGVIL